MDQDFSSMLSFEVKKEIADRYFGFRRLIETDKEQLAAEIQEQERSLGQRICDDLVRLYVLLGDEELSRRFLALIGFDPDLFFDPYLPHVSSAIRRRLFAGRRRRGLTLAGKYKNLLFDSYEELKGHADLYRERFAQLMKEHDVINEEIRLFYAKNDIGGIMDFLRRLDGPAPDSLLDGAMPVAGHDHLDRKMRIEPLPPLESLLAVVPPVPPLGRVKGELRRLADEGWQHHGKAVMASLLG